MTVDTCLNCKHYLGGLSCLAFAIIPKEILNGENDHSEKIPNQDNDFVFVDKSVGNDDYLLIKRDK